MQPPPPSGPPGSNGPPRMSMTNNAYRRKCGPTPTAAAAASVQPVTDPFAFGRMTPQNTTGSNAARGNLLAMPSPSPSLYHQPVPVSASAVGENSQGTQASAQGSVPQAVPRGSQFTGAAGPSTGGGYFTNSAASVPSSQPGLGHPPSQPFHYMASGLENAFLPVQNRSQSRQSNPPDLNNTGAVSAPLPSFVPAPPQQSTGPWGSMQGAPPTSAQNFPPASQHQSYNASYSSPPYLEVSNLPPQAPFHPNDTSYLPMPPRSTASQFPVASGANNVLQHSSSQFSNVHQMDYMHSHRPEQSNWFKPPYKEQTHQPLPNPNLMQSGGPPSVPEQKLLNEREKAATQSAPSSESGTVSMFFKGDEAENVEIISSMQQHTFNRQSYDVSQFQNMGHQVSVPSSQPQTSVANIQPQSSVALGPSSPNSQPFLSQNINSPHEPQATWQHDIYAVGDHVPVEAGNVTEPPFDNVENIECIQNQEVLPNDPNISLVPSSANSDLFRYGPVPGPNQPKNAIPHTEGGPNLEMPDCLNQPVRSDSVSSNYSSLSHRSLQTGNSSANRPQELVGTFIQKESGKLENDPANSFFKQIDSSPMGGDVIAQATAQNNFHGSLSQPPTPSPPKPTGIFQTSANSSFEPVRSHAVGLKPAEVDQSKVVVEGREGFKLPPNNSQGINMLAASPGNLEHPPDNMETVFSDKPNPLLFAANTANVFKSVGGPPLDNTAALLDRRPPSRAHGSNKKCESPATTLWAQGELPNFGGNVLLAPAAPALYVPPKSQVEVIQPPEEGLSGPQPSRPELAKYETPPEQHVSSENLENPPKITDDDQLHSQASSGYASLLSSPPTESLQNQPVLIAPPNKAYNLLQPINFSLSLPNQVKNLSSANDSAVTEKLAPTSIGSNFNLNENASLIQAGPVLNTPVSSNQLNNKSTTFNNHAHEPFPNQQLNNVMPSANQLPLNLVTENQKTVKGESALFGSVNKSFIPVSAGSNLPVGNGNGMFAPPVSMSGGSVNRSNSQVENAGALDFTVPRAPANHSANNEVPIPSRPLTGGPVFPIQSVSVQNFQPGVDINKQGFYQQVTDDRRRHPVLGYPQQGQGTSQEYMVPVSQPLSLSSSQSAPVPKPMSYQPQIENQVADVQQPPVGHPITSASELSSKYGPSEPLSHTAQTVPGTSAPVSLNNIAGYPPPPRPPASQTPQQADSYYYYRTYGTYPPAYQPMESRAAHMYYQDPYAAYDPAYVSYQGKYPYKEPERPSSRASQSSDRPSSRQGYGTKGDWAAPANYYPEYFQGHYEYGDPSRWDRYPGAYDPGYRDPRNNYWNYMYGSIEDPYQRKVPYAYPSRYDVYEDRWQYDPRYVGGFDDENEPRRDLAKDDFDRRSVHSEHSARSLRSEHSTHSRRSSFSSHSQHSQIYKSQQDLTAGAYDSQVANPSLTDYTYGLYPSDYNNQQPVDSYQYGYQSNTEWQALEQAPARPMTPEKFGSPHVCARFGPGGHLIKVLPNLPSDGQPTLVEIHNMEVIMQSSPEQEELRSFPGPLVKDETHKVDVINFAQNKAKESSHNENLLDQESTRLLWDLIVLLCRQNGTVVGTDIAELLLQDHRTVWLPGKSPNEANLIDFSNEPLEQEEESGASQLSFLTDSIPCTGRILEKETERFRELLLFGRKKDALESAMKHGLWGHALLLASKMDSRTHARVMTRFANSLPINDPLQTVYQLLSGRMPAAATCCGDEKWGDWRPHIAMVLSNITNNVDVPTRTITTMGDTLASRGLLDAAHFCYLMAQVGFGFFTKKSTKLVLIGSNHSLPFTKFATNEAIQRTEAYEYSQSLGAQTISLPNIQVFKFIYACRLAECGLCAQAFHYCEVIAKTVLRHPSYYSPVLVSQLLEVSSHLRFFDPQLKEKPEQELFIEPPWLLRLRHLDMQIKQGTVVYNTGRTTPQQYACSTPSSEVDHISQTDGMVPPPHVPAGTDNPLLANYLPNIMPDGQNIQLVLPGPENAASVYQPPAGNESSYPGTPQSLGPTSGYAPPISGLQFVPFSNEQTATYAPSVADPLTPPPQPTDFVPQWNQDPGAQRIPQHSPTKTTFDSGFDFYGEMAKMAPGQRSRTVSQSSSHIRRTRTTSESSTHSIGSARRSSVGMQPSPPPPPIPELDKPEAKKESKAHKASQGNGRSWFPLKIGWLMGKGKNEAHLPDDRNKSIVWDEKKQRWINMDEPDGEESKPLPPPPAGMPRPQNMPAGPGGPPNPSVNMFSIRAAGARGRYVDVLNPNGGSRPSNTVPPPADLFAPLAPMPMSANLFVPNAVPEQDQPAEASGAEIAQPADQAGHENPQQAQLVNPASFPPGADLPGLNQDDCPQGEVSNNTVPDQGPPTGAVTFYNPSKFAQQPPGMTGGARPGRLGQRKYPSLK
ncbi:protein transport protein Sec16A isoform X3 [Pelobates fuscus]|uniref:protein transport protein Sec16A isoform X3 n=1 Tax=Pelobates fuscus TaxID=191477 RepID=UPI002FE437E9